MKAESWNWAGGAQCSVGHLLRCRERARAPGPMPRRLSHLGSGRPMTRRLWRMRSARRDRRIRKLPIFPGHDARGEAARQYVSVLSTFNLVHLFHDKFIA